MRLSNVVLPAPFGPTIPTASPSSTENDRLSMTGTPKDFCSPSTAISATSGRSPDGHHAGAEAVEDVVQLGRHLAQLEPLDPRQERGEQRAQLQAGQVAARARVGAEAEAEVLGGVGPRDVEPRGIGELALVAVG